MSQSDRTFDYRPVLAARAALRRKALVTQYVTLQTQEDHSLHHFGGAGSNDWIEPVSRVSALIASLIVTVAGHFCRPYSPVGA